MKDNKRKFILWFIPFFLFHCSSRSIVFPEKRWEFTNPADLKMDVVKLDSLANLIGGRGCVVKDGYMVKTWGDQSEKSDWLSSVKPIFSTLLFFAIEEGKLSGVYHKIRDLGWKLKPKDQDMTFYHLANMTSGYARPERPGEAWAYNDYAIQLYHKSLFEKVFQEKPINVLKHPDRLGPLQFQDDISFGDDKPRIYASVRDFARFAWFWCNRGEWKGKQLLPRKYFEHYMKPHTPKDLPHTRSAKTDDYLNIGSFGGGSDHFTKYGAGIYGFNWWFNDTGRLHPNQLTWPDAPKDTFMSIGAGGNNSVIIPSLNLILVSAKGKWGDLKPGNSENLFNRYIELLVSAVKGQS